MLPGLVLSGTLAVASIDLGQVAWLQRHGLGVLTLALLMGMLIGNVLPSTLSAASAAGVGLCKQCLLRLGVVLYGMGLTWHDLGQVGAAGVAVDVLVLVSTFLLAAVLGVGWLRMDRRLALLVAAGSAICGAAAVLAAEPIVRARTEQVTVAISTVVVFGTAAVFLYPLLFSLNEHWSLIPGGSAGFGLYTGSTVHEVAQVIAAAHPLGDQATAEAVIAKMVRVMMLAPVLLALSWYLTRCGAGTVDATKRATPGPRVVIPWFAVAFIVAIGVHSLQLLPAAIVAGLMRLDGGLLATAMAALGLTTRISALRQAGMRPLLLGAVVFAWLVIGGGAINHWLAPATP